VLRCPGRGPRLAALHGRSSFRSCLWTKVHHAADYPPGLIIGTRNHTRDLHVADVNGERDTGGPNRASSERTHSAADRATVLSMSGRGAGPLAWPSDGQMCGGARLDPCPACAHGIPRRLPTLRRRTPREPRPPGRWAAPMNPLSSRAAAPATGCAAHRHAIAGTAKHMARRWLRCIFTCGRNSPATSSTPARVSSSVLAPLFS